MKKISVIPLLLLFLFLVAGPAMAQPKEVIFRIGDQNYFVDGVNLYTDVVPFELNNQVYVPLRCLAQALGVNVQWNGAINQITLQNNGTEIDMETGNKVYQLNGRTMVMDAPPIMVGDRVFLPARFVSENFGYEVAWNQGTQNVTIQQPVTPPKTTIPSPTTTPPKEVGVINGPFQAAISNIKFDVGSNIAYVNVSQDSRNGYKDDGTQTILPAAPYVAVPNQNQVFVIQANNAAIYTKYLPVVDTQVLATETYYVPAVPLFQAFGVPMQNISWDGTKLDVYISDTTYIEFKADQQIYMLMGPNQQNTLRAPLRVENNAPMLPAEDFLNIARLFLEKQNFNMVKNIPGGYIVFTK